MDAAESVQQDDGTQASRAQIQPGFLADQADNSFIWVHLFPAWQVRSPSWIVALEAWVLTDVQSEDGPTVMRLMSTVYKDNPVLNDVLQNP